MKGFTLDWLEEVFIINKVENTVSGTYVINTFKVKEIVGTFYQKDNQLQKQIKQSLEMKN